jgi:hypothetical protein
MKPKCNYEGYMDYAGILTNTLKTLWNSKKYISVILFTIKALRCTNENDIFPLSQKYIQYNDDFISIYELYS